MKKLLNIIIIVCLSFTLVSCNKSDTTTLVLDYTPNTNHTGIYIAKELGYYEEVGINLDIIQPPESGAPILVAAGKADFGISFQDDLAAAYGINQPLEITTISTIVNHNTSGFIYSSSLGINSPKDFEGKKVVIWDTPIITEIVKTIVAEDGGNPDNVEIIFNTVSDPIQLLADDKDIIVWGFAGWDLSKAELEGLDVEFMELKEINPTFDYYTPVIIAGNKLIENDPTLVKNFLAATKKGYEYAINNPVEAIAIMNKAVPEIDVSLLESSQMYLSSQYQADAENWGEIDSLRWNNFYSWVYDKNLAENEISDESFTNKFILEG